MRFIPLVILIVSDVIVTPLVVAQMMADDVTERIGGAYMDMGLLILQAPLCYAGIALTKQGPI